MELCHLGRGHGQRNHEQRDKEDGDQHDVALLGGGNRPCALHKRHGCELGKEASLALRKRRVGLRVVVSQVSDFNIERANGAHLVAMVDDVAGLAMKMSSPCMKKALSVAFVVLE